jgi:hypothetical protein
VPAKAPFPDFQGLVSADEASATDFQWLTGENQASADD